MAGIAGGHSVLVGHGRVGSVVAAALLARGEPFVVIEDGDAIVVRGADAVIMGEREIARGMIEHAIS